jgi:hypothetical protein
MPKPTPKTGVKKGATSSARARTTPAPKRAKTTTAGLTGLVGAPNLVMRRAVIDAASSGDNTLVAAVAGAKIRVLSLCVISAGSVTVRFESGAGGTALTGQMTLVAGSGFVLPHNEDGWFETDASALLNLELSGAVSVDGCLNYRRVGS